MIDLARVGSNAMVVLILFGIGYMIHKSSGGKSTKLKEKLMSFMGGGLKK